MSIVDTPAGGDTTRVEVQETYVHAASAASAASAAGAATGAASAASTAYVAEEPPSVLLRYLDRAGLAMSAARDKAAHALERARKNYSGLVRAHAAHEQDRGRPPTAPPVQATVIRAQFDVDENGIVGAAPR